MLRVSTVIVSLLCATNVMAADVIANYVKSHVMRDNTIVVSTITGKKILQYNKGNGSYGELKDTSFLADGEKGVVVVIKDFNPLRNFIKTEIVAKDETIFDVSKITAEAKKAAGAMKPVALLDKSLLSERTYLALGEKACSDYYGSQKKVYDKITADYLKLLAELDLGGKEINQDSLDELMKSRRDWLPEIQEKGNLTTVINEYNAGIKKTSKLLDALLNEIEDNFKNADNGFNQCPEKYSIPLYVYWTTVNEIKDVYLKKLEANKSMLEKMKSMLSSYKEDRKVIDEKNNIMYEWVGDDLHLSFDAPTRKKFMSVNLTYGDIKISYDDTTIKETNAITGSFEYHKREYIVPEVGTGYLYSGVRNKTWGTKTVNGQTVVVKLKDEAMIGHAAITLNGIILTSPDSWVYPMVQFGIATDKDTPAFTTGVGFRLIDTPLAFAVGAIYSFNKELESLKEGDVVTGTADIEANLKYHPTASWYVGLQYNF